MEPFAQKVGGAAAGVESRCGAAMSVLEASLMIVDDTLDDSSNRHAARSRATCRLVRSNRLTR
jgi:hypothetical protein